MQLMTCPTYPSKSCAFFIAFQIFIAFLSSESHASPDVLILNVYDELNYEVSLYVPRKFSRLLGLNEEFKTPSGLAGKTIQMIYRGS